MAKSVKLVGILNVTPDSFSDGGHYFDAVKAMEHARQMFKDGAALIDVGAESTNPWSQPLSLEEEWQRLEPVLKHLVKDFPGKISVDTYHPQTARKAAQAGATIINDVTMFRDPDMVKLAADYKDKLTYIVSHLSPKATSIADAHKNAPTRTVSEVKGELLAKRDELIKAGVPTPSIILDPGVGFGKTADHDWKLNWQLLEFAKEIPGIDVMIGYSRKRFLGEDRMQIELNIKAAKIAIASGAKYLRVHDVAAHAKALGINKLALIAFGGNVGNVLEGFKYVLKQLETVGTIKAKSKLYKTAPVGGPPGQDDYLNGVVELHTSLEAEELLDLLLKIENERGRERSIKWGPRTLDLDLLDHDRQTIDSPKLTLPHPHMWQRAFVLIPLTDIKPNYKLPGKFERLKDRLEKLDKSGVELTDLTW